MTTGPTSSTLVCFEAGGKAYGVPLAAARFVRTSEQLVTLPNPAPGVAGLLPGEPPLTVVSPLDAEGGHIIVLETRLGRFGLLVDVVTGLQKVETSSIRPSPRGQGRSVVSGTFDREGTLVLVADPDELAAAL